MQAPDVETTAASTIKLGVLTLAAALITGAWELIALQVPGSPLYIGVLPGPIGALRELCVVLGLLTLAAGALMPRAYESASARRARGASILIAVGVALACASQAYGAAHGMHGVQMSDLRADARAVFFLRHGGLLLFALGWIDLGLRVLRRPSAT
jgi:hypothetical protein